MINGFIAVVFLTIYFVMTNAQKMAIDQKMVTAANNTWISLVRSSGVLGTLWFGEKMLLSLANV